MANLDRPDDVCGYAEYQRAFNNRLRNGQLIDSDQILTMYLRLQDMLEALKIPVQVQAGLGATALDVILLNDDLRPLGVKAPGDVWDGIWNSSGNPPIMGRGGVATYNGVFQRYDDGIDSAWLDGASELVSVVARRSIDTSAARLR